MKYLIEKRGLYYRSNSRGYTGLKSEAGRYSLEEVAFRFPNMESPNQDGMTYIPVKEAPEYSKACPWDVRMNDKAFKEGYEARDRELRPLLDNIEQFFKDELMLVLENAYHTEMTSHYATAGDAGNDVDDTMQKLRELLLQIDVDK